MRIYMGESDRWQGEPLYEAIVQRLRLMDIAGATVYRGILGYGVKGHTHKSGVLPFSHDLPVMISVVDAEEKLSPAIDEIEAMMQDGLIVLSDVDVIRLVHTSRRESAMRTVKQATAPPAAFWRKRPAFRASRSTKRSSIAARSGDRRRHRISRPGGIWRIGGIHRRHLITKDQPMIVTIVDTADNLARLIPEIEAMMDSGMIATSEVECIRIEHPPAVTSQSDSSPSGE